MSAIFGRVVEGGFLLGVGALGDRGGNDGARLAFVELLGVGVLLDQRLQLLLALLDHLLELFVARSQREPTTAACSSV